MRLKTITFQKIGFGFIVAWLVAISGVALASTANQPRLLSFGTDPLMEITLDTESSSSALAPPVCPSDFPLYCAMVNRCCPLNFGYYCTRWQSLPEPSPLSQSLKGPCLNIQRFTEGQQYYLEKYCEPHGCGSR